MKQLVIVAILILSACQYKPIRIQHGVYLSKDLIYPLSNVASSELNEEIVHKVVFEAVNQERHNYLVQLDIQANENTMALVATSLLGVPLIAFTVEDRVIVNANKLSDLLPSPERLLVDLQMMLWPVESLSQLKGVEVIERCPQLCTREISVDDELVAKIDYSKGGPDSNMVFHNLIHQYKMTIKVL